MVLGATGTPGPHARQTVGEKEEEHATAQSLRMAENPAQGPALRRDLVQEDTVLWMVAGATGDPGAIAARLVPVDLS